MRVIELALKQINDHTDITATYEQHKKGRTITGFSFKFKQKKKTELKRQKTAILAHVSKNLVKSLPTS
jgi:plasmid replication initiation protein